MRDARRSLSLWLLLGTLACGGAPPPPPPSVITPTPDEGVAALESRRQAQIAAAGRIHALHDFHFTDALAASGITFVHHIVEDAGKAPPCTTIT
jgi:hypothetical protein